MSFGVGVVGCGNISSNYLQNAKLFSDISLKAVGDLNDEAATARSKEFGVEKYSVDAILKRKDIEVILNLTPPSAHASVTRAALGAGKHVYSEKPLAISFEEGLSLACEAEQNNLVLGMAPDTFLGASHQLARQFIDSGKIGQVVGGVAFFLSPGMESWHPNPGFFFKSGGGPLLDMAPYYLTALVNLLGPVKTVTAMSSTPRDRRLVTAPVPVTGYEIPVEVPTSYWGVATFASGAIVSLGFSWDVMLHSLPHIELYGLKGSLRLADPDQFGGAVHLSNQAQWETTVTTGHQFGGIDGVWTDFRILGLAEMLQAIKEKRAPRASIGRALHVLEIIQAMNSAARDGTQVVLSTTCERSLPFDPTTIRLRSANKIR